MKRFTCTTCGRKVRVRRLPNNVTGQEDEHGHLHKATGVCRHHGSDVSRNRVNDRVRVVAGIGSTRRVSASSAKSKSKR